MRKIVIVEMIFAVLLAGLLALLLSKKPLNDVSCETIKKAFLKEESSEGMEAWDGLRLRRDFNLEEAEHEDFVLYGEPDTMAVRIFLVLKCRNEEQTEPAVRAFERYLERQKEAFEGYGASQMKLLEQARIYKKGRYAALVIAEDPDEWIRVITELTEG